MMRTWAAQTLSPSEASEMTRWQTVCRATESWLILEESSPASSSSLAMTVIVSRTEKAPIRMGAELATITAVEAVAARAPGAKASSFAGDARPAPRGSSLPARATPSATATAVAWGAQLETIGCEETRVVCWLEPILELARAASFSATSEMRTELLLNASDISSVLRSGVQERKLK